MTTVVSEQRRLVVGDSIEMDFGAFPVRGVVLEDRGDYGRESNQVVRIALALEEDEGETEFEIPAQRLRLVKPVKTD